MSDKTFTYRANISISYISNAQFGDAKEYFDSIKEDVLSDIRAELQYYHSCDDSDITSIESARIVLEANYREDEYAAGYVEVVTTKELDPKVKKLIEDYFINFSMEEDLFEEFTFNYSYNEEDTEMKVDSDLMLV